MRIVDRLKAAWRSLTYEDFLSKGLIEMPTVAGVRVDQTSAKSVTAYWDGVCVIAGDIGARDRHLYRRVDNDDRERATTHPVYKLVHDQPNPYQGPQVFWETLTSHAVSWGNGYAEIEFDKAARPIALWPIPPSDIEPVCDPVTDAQGRKRSELWYRYKGSQRLEAWEILHVHGLGFDGIRGYSPVELFRRALGLTIAAETFGGAFYGNGAWFGVALEHPKTLSGPAQDRLRQSIENMHRGPDRAHRLMILEEGMKASKPLTIPPDDAQFLETRQFQIEEIARMLNLLPHKLKHKVGERPGGNLEEAETEHERTTLLPWARRIEQECNLKLITKAQRGTYYVEHLFDATLRADAETRMKIQQGYLEMGVLTPAQVAQQQNLPTPEPRVDELGMKEKIEAVGQLIRAGFEAESSLAALGLPSIKHTGQLPVTTREEDPPATPPPASGDDAEADRSIVVNVDVAPAPVQLLPAPPAAGRSAEAAHRAIYLEAAGRFVRREAEKAKRACKRGPQAFEAWIEEFYGGEVQMLRELLRPLVALRIATAGLDSDAREEAEEIAAAYVAESKAELLALPAKDLETAVPKLLDRWETIRAVEVADKIAALGAAKEKGNAA